MIGSLSDPVCLGHAKTAEKVPSTGMAAITDVGMEMDIHPKKKQPVGHQLALQGMNKVNEEEDVLCEAPTLREGRAKDRKLVLTFEHAGSGLSLSDKTPDGATADKNLPGDCKSSQRAARWISPTWLLSWKVTR